MNSGIQVDGNDLLAMHVAIPGRSPARAAAPPQDILPPRDHTTSDDAKNIVISRSRAMENPRSVCLRNTCRAPAPKHNSPLSQAYEDQLAARYEKKSKTSKKKSRSHNPTDIFDYTQSSRHVCRAACRL
jgi:hypothetical protein